MPATSLTIGNKGIWPFLNPYRLSGKKLKTHMKIMGLSGMGKSYFIDKAATYLINQGMLVSLIDTHSDLAHDTLRLLYESGYFKKPRAFDKLWFIDFARPDQFVPFNILKQPYPLYTIARNVQEAFFRAFPSLAGGVAPQFQNVLQYTIITLAENKLPVTYASKLLAHRTYREQLLKNCTHQPTIDFFHDRFDRWGREQSLMVESTLNKIDLFSFTDHMRYALCQLDNQLEFRRIIDQGISVIFNLGGPTIDEETQRLLGCLITVGFEQAALSRGDLQPSKRRPYFLIIDEFPSFATANGDTYANILSQARKFHVYLWLVHQTLEQLPEGLQTAVQNAGIEVNFGLGASDAVEVARRIINYSDEIKHEVADPVQIERTHPLFRNVQEQERILADKLHNLWEQEAIITLRRQVPLFFRWFLQPYKNIKVKTQTVPKQYCREEDLQQVKDYYAQRLLRRREYVEREMQIKPRTQKRRASILQEEGGEEVN